jgi:regulator of protease activity HflC (stomatin/prohibitin superfamily)
MFVLVIVLILVGVVFAITSIKIVKQSEVFIIERLGKFHKKAESGLNIVIPLLDRVAAKIDLRTIVVDSPPQAVITKDNVTMDIDTVVYYQVTDPYKAEYEIQNLKQAIRYLTITILRDIIGTIELDQTLSSRDEINTRLRKALDDATDNWGVRVERVEVKTINLPEDIKEAMEKQMRAEREKRAEILEAEGKKQAAIETAEGNKISEILSAEAKREAQIRESEGKAKAIQRIAQAESERIVKIYKALKDSNIDESMLSVKYIEAINEMAKGSNKVFMPFETSKLLGAMGSIKSLDDVVDFGIGDSRITKEKLKDLNLDKDLKLDKNIDLEKNGVQNEKVESKEK